MKARTLACTALAATLLAGCSGASTSISNGNEKLMTIGNKTFTTQDEYQLILRSAGPSQTMSMAMQLIYDSEAPVDEAMEKEAEETYETYSGGSDDFEETLKLYGYADKQAFIDESIIPGLQAEKLKEKYFEDNQEEVEAQFHPVLASVIQTDSEDNANKALQALKDGTDAAKVAAQYGMEDSTYDGTEQIITSDNTSLPTVLVNKLTETTEPGVLDEVYSDDTSTDDKTYYVAVLVSNDYQENVEKIAQALSSNSTISTDSTVFYLKKYNFQVHDQFIFDYYKANNPEYLVTRPDLSED